MMIQFWSRSESWREANERFWYRKFYQEMRTGQLMVLRPDEPPCTFTQRAERMLPEESRRGWQNFGGCYPASTLCFGYLLFWS